MKRIHRSLLTAGVLFLGGGGGALYVYQTRVQTADARYLAEQEAKRLFRFGRGHVRSGRLVGRNATLAFTRDDVFTWRITEPVDWPADVRAIDAMLDRMAAIKMEPVVTESASPADLARAGLDQPHTRLTVHLTEDTHVLAVGKRNKLVDKFLVTDAHATRIGLSEPSFFGALDRDLFAFRSKRLFPFSAGRVQHIEIDGPDGAPRVRISRNDRGFEVSGSGIEGAVPGDVGEIERLLVTLTRHLVAERFVTDTRDAAEEHGRPPPRVTVRLRTTGATSAERLVTDTRGAAEERGRPPPHVTVRPRTSGETARSVRFGTGNEPNAHVEGTTTVVAVDRALVDQIDRPAETYRDRSIVRYNPSDVHRIRVTVGAHPPFVVERSAGGTDWTIVEPVERPAKIWRVDNLVLVYSKLEGRRIYRLNPRREELTEWQLEPAARRLELFDARGRPLADLRLGKYATEEEVFAMNAGQTRVSVIADSKLKIFPTSVQDLIDPEWAPARGGQKVAP